MQPRYHSHTQLRVYDDFSRIPRTPPPAAPPVPTAPNAAPSTSPALAPRPFGGAYAGECGVDTHESDPVYTFNSCTHTPAFWLLVLLVVLTLVSGTLF